jgi:hypothetical protein
MRGCDDQRVKGGNSYTDTPDIQQNRKGGGKKKREKRGRLGWKKMGRKVRKTLAEECWMVPTHSGYMIALTLVASSKM